MPPSRRVVAWRVSITLETAFCIEAVEEALARHGAPEIFNSPTSAMFRNTLPGSGSGQSVYLDRLHQGAGRPRDQDRHACRDIGCANALAVTDGKRAWRDNVFVECLWRSIEYEEVYLRAYASVCEAGAGSDATSASTTAAVPIHRLTAKHRIRPASTSRCQMRWRRNQGGKHSRKARNPFRQTEPPLPGNAHVGLLLAVSSPRLQP